jgi:TfoX/Sxy family transcriptional regulator of competence genes
MVTGEKPGATPKWHPAPDSLVRLFEKAMEALPQAKVRKMFGYPAAFVNDQMFAGLYQDSIFLRLGVNDRARFLKIAGSSVFEPMRGRPMREYVVVPESVFNSGRTFHTWLLMSLSYARNLPPKTSKTTVKTANPSPKS